MTKLHRSRHFSFAIVLFCLVGSGVFVVVNPRLYAANPTTAPSSDASALRRQRIETLEQASSAARQEYTQGLVSIAEVFRLDRLVLEAQLESATTRDERIKLLQSELDVAKRQEDLVASHLKSGTATAVAALEAKADRLGIEIRLAEAAAK